METFTVTVNGKAYTVQAKDPADARVKAHLQAAQERVRQSKTNRTLEGATAAALTGVRTGSEALVGLPGDAPNLAGGATSWVSRKTGLQKPEDAYETGKSTADVVRRIIDPVSKYTWLAKKLGYDVEERSLFPTSQEVNQAVTSAYPDEATRRWTQHQPEGATERMLFTAGTMAPNLLIPGTGVMSGVVGPTLGAEAGGAIGDLMGYEEAGRFVGGIGGSLLPGGVTRGITGPTLSNERARLAQLMGDEGIDLTAGQVSGRKGLQYREVGPYETKPAGIAEQQQEQFNRAATSRTGYPEGNANPETIRNMRDEFGQEYDDVIRQTGGLHLDRQAETDLLQLVYDYHELKALPNNAPTSINSFFDRISRAAHANGGVIPTEVFQQTRSDISKMLRRLNGSDPAQERALRDIQDMMYDSIGRNSPPGVEATWRDINNRYRNFKIIERSMMGAGEATAEGGITPQKLRTSVQQADPQDYVAGQGDFADLARGGELFMKPLPQSGTSPRALTWGVPAAAAGAAGHAAMGGDLKQALTSLVVGGLAPMIPAGISSALTSRPVREALIRRITGEQGHFAPASTGLSTYQLQNDQPFGGPR